jgi:hypothetical protein
MTRLHRQGGGQVRRPCFNWQFVARGTGSREQIDEHPELLWIRGVWQLFVYKPDMASIDCFCCPNGMGGFIRAKVWVRHPQGKTTFKISSGGDLLRPVDVNEWGSWSPDNRIDIGDEAIERRRSKRQAIVGAPFGEGHTKWPDPKNVPNGYHMNQMHFEKGTGATAWHDGPGIGYDTSAGNKTWQAHLWWFYIEIWRDCLADGDDRVVDRAHFGVGVAARMEQADGGGLRPRARLFVKPLEWMDK